MNVKERGRRVYNILWIYIAVFIILSSRTSAPIEVATKTPKVHSSQIMRPPGSPELYLPVKTTPKPVVKKKPRYGFKDEEIYLLTVLLCGSGKRDGDGEYDFDFGNQDDTEQITLVLSVVMNRVESKKFPDTVSEVIWAQNQFVYMPHWKNGLPKVKPESYAIVKEWCESYDAWDPNAITIPKTHLYFSGNGRVNKSSTRW